MNCRKCIYFLKEDLHSYNILCSKLGDTKAAYKCVYYETHKDYIKKQLKKVQKIKKQDK